MRTPTYSGLIVFPVEFVGRSGSVRVCGFEEALQLYTRRKLLAPSRIGDDVRLRDEQRHCENRIEQLRRSYFLQHGWASPDGHDLARQAMGLHVADLAAFLRRTLQRSDMFALKMERLADGADNRQRWFVVFDGEGPGLQLWFQRFAGAGAEQRRERLRDDLQQLPWTPATSSPDAECLLSSHHDVDASFVLTGRAQDFASIRRGDSTPIETLAHQPNGLWSRCLCAAAEQDTPAVIDGCRRLLTAQPWHRRAYVLLCAVTASAGLFDAVHEAATRALRFFPGDPQLQRYRAFASSHAGNALPRYTSRGAFWLMRLAQRDLDAVIAAGDAHHLV